MQSSPALKKLKAFAPIDASGRIVYNSTVYRKRMPKVGRWIALERTTLCCDPNPITALAAVADPTSIEVGADSTFTISATFKDGTTQDVSDSATLVSSDTDIATAADNVVTGVAEGTADITASYQGVSADPVTITVTAAG